MSLQHIIYLHGFATSPDGRKGDYFRPRFTAVPDVTFHAFAFAPTPVDFEYLTVTGMINRLRQYILDRQWDTVSLIGSSMGGLVALNYAHQFGGVARLLLLSPALVYLSGERVGMSLAQWQAEGVGELFHYGFNRLVRLRYGLQADGRFYPTPPPPPVPTLIIHGSDDDVVPITDSRDYARRYPDRVSLREINARHDINDYLPFIWEVGQQFLLYDKRSG